MVLLAEDNEDNIDALLGFLKYQEYQVLVAKTGQEAIDLAQLHKPDIILMDMHMPNMDGIEATRIIRKLPSLSNTPIIALTALAMPGDKTRCLEAGADRYLSKPVKLKELATAIIDLLNDGET